MQGFSSEQTRLRLKRIKKRKRRKVSEDTTVHGSVTVDNCVPSSCQISSLLSLLENHIDLERNLLLTPTWIPCGVEKGLLYSLSSHSGLSNKLNKLLPSPYCLSLYQEGRRLVNSSYKQLSCRDARGDSAC